MVIRSSTLAYYHRLRPLTLPPPHTEEAAVFQIWKWAPLLTEGGVVKWTPLLSSESCQRRAVSERVMRLEHHRRCAILNGHQSEA